MNGPPSKQGYLVKKSQHIGQFRKRWIVIKDNYLYSYKNRESFPNSKPTETIDLKSFKEIRKSATNKPNQFELISNDIKRVFIAESIDNMNEWIIHIHQVLDIYNTTINYTYSTLIDSDDKIRKTEQIKAEYDDDDRKRKIEQIKALEKADRLKRQIDVGYTVNNDTNKHYKIFFNVNIETDNIYEDIIGNTNTLKPLLADLFHIESEKDVFEIKIRKKYNGFRIDFGVIIVTSMHPSDYIDTFDDLTMNGSFQKTIKNGLHLDNNPIVQIWEARYEKVDDFKENDVDIKVADNDKNLYDNNQNIDTWTCDICGFSNVTENDKCAMCNVDAPQQQIKRDDNWSNFNDGGGDDWGNFIDGGIKNDGNAIANDKDHGWNPFDDIQQQQKQQQHDQAKQKGLQEKNEPFNDPFSDLISSSICVEQQINGGGDDWGNFKLNGGGNINKDHGWDPFDDTTQQKHASSPVTDDIKTHKQEKQKAIQAKNEAFIDPFIDLIDSSKQDQINDDEAAPNSKFEADHIENDGANKQFYYFLKEHRLDKYFDKFKENECCDIRDIEYLLNDDDFLRNDIGIKNQIERRRFLGEGNKLKNSMDVFKNINSLPSILIKKLAKSGIVTMDILCNEVSNKLDLKNKLKIKDENQCDLLWNLISSEMHAPQNQLNNEQYQQEGVAQTPYI